jgi:hypothetical protein
MILYLSKQKNFKLEDIVPCQDGFMILKELFYDNILEECETAIINRYNFNVKLNGKGFDEKFIIPIYTPIINEEEQIEIEKEKEKSIVEHKNKINSLFDDNEDYLNVFPIEILMIGIDENEPNKEEAIEAHRINCKPPQGFDKPRIRRPILSSFSKNSGVIMLISSIINISVFFHFRLDLGCLRILVASSSADSLPSPTPAQLWSVFAKDPRRRAAQPVKAVTAIFFPFTFPHSTICRMRKDLPAPAGPVRNMFLPL